MQMTMHLSMHLAWHDDLRGGCRFPCMCGLQRRRGSSSRAGACVGGSTTAWRPWRRTCRPWAPASSSCEPPSPPRPSLSSSATSRLRQGPFYQDSSCPLDRPSTAVRVSALPSHLRWAIYGGHLQYADRLGQGCLLKGVVTPALFAAARIGIPGRLSMQAHIQGPRPHKAAHAFGSDT